MEKIKIAFDVMGYEGHIKEAVESAIDFVTKNSDVEIAIFGNKLVIDSYKDIGKYKNISIFHTDVFINQNDDALSARRKTNSSLNMAIQHVKDLKSDCLVSACATIPFVSQTYTNFGLIKNISKPAFMPYVPTSNRKGFVLLDVGANKTNSGKELYEFAKIANVYSKNVLNINNPIIKVLNIGTEDFKGLDFHQEANKLIKEDNNLNYKGFIEPKELLEGGHDIIICDGYSGNLVLKSLEGTMKTLNKVIRKKILNPFILITSIPAVISIKRISKIFDYKNNAGAIVIGLNRIAVKTHGSADKKQFDSTLLLAYKSAKAKIISKISDEFRN